VEARAKAVDGTEIEGQEIEEEGAFGFGRNRKHIPTRARVDAFKYMLQIGRFATIANAIVDDLAMDLVGRDVDECHRCQVPLITEE
jgi:hypothetical protein